MRDLSITVMAHPKRDRFVADLYDKLPITSVTWDRYNDRIETGLRSLQAWGYGPLQAWEYGSRYHMVIQDDALPCEGLVEAIEQITSLHPGLPIGLYTGQGDYILPAYRMAERRGYSLVSGIGGVRGVAAVFPVDMISGLLRHYKQSEHPNYDGRITEWFRDRRQEALYTVPSLVDHRPVDENPSLIPGRTGSRSAVSSQGESSAAERDWSKILRWEDSVCSHNKHVWDRCPACGRWKVDL